MKTAYHHGNLRTELVQTATELARSAGPDGVVLREVARRAGVSHNAAYRHFADRDALLAAIADEGMLMLEQAMRNEMESVTETEPRQRAVERLRAVGRAYVEFAHAEPGIFEVTFDGCEITAEDRYMPPLESAFALLNEVLDEGLEAGFVRSEARPGAEVSCWAGVHGFAVLHQRGPLRHSRAEDRKAALEHLLDVLESGLS